MAKREVLVTGDVGEVNGKGPFGMFSIVPSTACRCTRRTRPTPSSRGYGQGNRWNSCTSSTPGYGASSDGMQPTCGLPDTRRCERPAWKDCRGSACHDLPKQPHSSEP